MKLRIKVKVLTEGCLPEILDKGDWIDLRSGEEYVADKEEYHLFNLGVAVKLPRGFEAVVAPRSSTFKNFGILLANSVGVIDNSYSGNSDEWKFPAYCTQRKIVRKGDRICQFRIQPSQRATFWQKLRWLLSSGIRIVEVDSLEGPDRGGIGSTGVR